MLMYKKIIIKVVCCIAFTLSVSSAVAGDTFVDPFSANSSNIGESAFNTAYSAAGFDVGGLKPYQKGEASESIDPHKGSLTRVYTDYVFPGNGGMDVAITRSYNNLQNATSSEIDPAFAGEQDYMGAGWALHFGRIWVTDIKDINGWHGRQIPSIDNVISNCNSFGVDNLAGQKNPILELPDGSREVIYSTNVASGNHEDFADFLTTRHWLGRCLKSSEDETGDGGLVLFSPTGLKYTFNKFGALATPKTWGGLGVANYPLAKSGYVVTKIEDLNNNTIIFTYEKNAADYIRISSISRSDQPSTIDFSYDGDKLHQISSGAINIVYTHLSNQLKKVTIAGLLDWDYEYYDPNMYGAYSISKVTSPTGKVTEYKYGVKLFIDYIPEGEIPLAVKDGLMSVGLIERKVSGSAVSEKTTYEYEPGGGDDLRDKTTVHVTSTDGVNYTTEYEHIGYKATLPTALGQSNNMWKRGLLIKKTITEQGAEQGEEQVETYAYEKRAFISSLYTWQAYPVQSQEGTWLPLLTSKTISRDGVSYSTQYQYKTGTTFPAEYIGGVPGSVKISLTNPVTKQSETGSGRVLSRDIKSQEILTFTEGKISGYKVVDAGWSLTDGGVNFWNQQVFDQNNGNLMAVSDNGYGTTYTYDSHGNVETVTNHKGEVTRHEDYTVGVPRISKFADGKIINRLVDERGNITSETTVTGGGSYTIGKSYDKINRIKSVTPPSLSSDAVTIEYPNPTTVNVIRGSEPTSTRLEARLYDGDGNLKSESINSIAREFKYDNMGNQIYASDFGGGTTHGLESVFDVFHRVKKVGRRDDTDTVSDFTYSLQNTVILRKVRGLGQFSDTMVYRAIGSPDQKFLIESRQDAGNNGIITTAYDRNVLGRINSVTQNGITQQYVYDELNDYPTRLIGEKRPDINIAYCVDSLDRIVRVYKTRSNYNVANHAGTCSLSSASISGGSSLMRKTYDAGGKVSTVQYGDDFPVSFNYNKFEKILTASKIGPRAENWTFGYDNNGNLTSESVNRNSETHTIGYAYNSLDQLTKLTYPNAHYVEFNPDPGFGRPQNIDYKGPGVAPAISLASNILYHPSGQLLSYQMGKNVQFTQSETTTGAPMPDSVQASNGAVSIFDLDYDYDGAGNPIKIDSSIADLKRTEIHYDGVSRLSDVKVSGVKYSYGYNLSGDIASLNIANKGMCEYSYDSGSKLLSSVTGGQGHCRDKSYNLSYDNGGNVQSTGIGIGSDNFVYNQAGLIKTFNGNEYARYDANNNRYLAFTDVLNAGQLEKRSLYSVYGTNGQLISDEDVKPPLSARNYRNYIYLAGHLVAKIDDCRIDANYAAGMCPDKDDDGDGLSYSQETDAGTSAFDSDSDHDGLKDGQEVTAGTNPTNNDTDGDGALDGDDLLPNDPSFQTYLDKSFDSDGIAISDFLNNSEAYQAIIQQPDGKLVAVNFSGQSLVRYYANGSIDSTFGNAGVVKLAQGLAYDLIQQSDGKLVVTGYSNDNLSNKNFYIARYTKDGVPDIDLNVDGFITGNEGRLTIDFSGYNNEVTSGYNENDQIGSITQQNDGKLVAAGIAHSSINVNTYPEYRTDFAVARFNGDGSLDNTFNSNGMVRIGLEPADGAKSSESVIQQADGKIVLAGYSYQNFSSAYVFTLVRLNSNGDLDSSFGTGGKVLTDIGTGEDKAFSIIQQFDGKLVVVGGSYVSSLQGNDFSIVRYDSNGSLDNSFNGTGKVTTNIYLNDTAYGVVQQQDGKLVVAGTSNGKAALVRYNADGSIDNTIISNSPSAVGNLTAIKTNPAINALRMQSDGKFLLAGGATQDQSNNSDNVIARYILNPDTDSDGVLDSADAFPQNPAETIDTDHDGSGDNGDADDDGDGINDTTDNCPKIPNASQLNSDNDNNGGNDCDPDDDNDGVADIVDIAPLDPSKKSDTDKDYLENSVDPDDDNDGVADVLDALPLNPNESADTDHDGIGNNSDPDIDGDGVLNAVDLWPLDGNEWQDTDGDGTGDYADTDADNDGVLDSTDNCLTVINANQNNIDGDALGDACDFDSDNDGVVDEFDIKPFDPTWKSYLDSRFSSDGILDAKFSDFASMKNGKLAVVDVVSSGNAQGSTIARYIGNGILDLTFGVNGYSNLAASYYLGDILQQKNGKFVIAGYVYTSTLDFALARYNQDGTLDSTFGYAGTVWTDIGSSFDSLSSIIQQQDEKLVAVGGGNISGGSGSYLKLARYNTNGTLDVSFNGSGTIALQIGEQYTFGNSVIQQADGKLVVVGRAVGEDGTHDFAVVRFTATGELDSGFDGDGIAITSVSDGFDWANSVLQQADGKLVVVGSGNNNNFFAMARYNSDGSLDTSFNATGVLVRETAGEKEVAKSLIQQSDGKLLVAGYSYSVSASKYSLRLTRYNSNGTLDNSFSLDGKLTIPVVAASEGNIAKTINQLRDGTVLITGPDNNNNSSIIKLIVSPDTDEDGIYDNADSHPMNPDFDNDTVLDGSDNCLSNSNANQLDTDMDGDGDACDSDDDNDNILDVADNCPLMVGDSVDSDNDGIGDICDSDDDNDGVADAIDNCPMNSNSSQSDVDYDGLGEACDDDDDNDGIADVSDSCDLIANRYNQTDSNLDFFGNACNADNDGDGVNDALELAIGTNPTVVDDSFRVDILAHQSNFSLDNRWVLAIANVSGLDLANLSVSAVSAISGKSAGTFTSNGSNLTYTYAGNSYSNDVISITLGDGVSTRTGVLSLKLKPVGYDLSTVTASTGRIIIDDLSSGVYGGGSGNDILLDGAGNDVLNVGSGSGYDIAYFNDATPNREDRLQFNSGLSPDNVRFAIEGNDLSISLPGTSGNLALIDYAKDVYRHAMNYMVFGETATDYVAVDDFFVMPFSQNQFVNEKELLSNDFHPGGVALYLNVSSLSPSSNNAEDSPWYENYWNSPGNGAVGVEFQSPMSLTFSYRVADHEATSSQDGFRAVVQLDPAVNSGIITGNASYARNEILSGIGDVPEIFAGLRGNDLFHTEDGPDTVLFGIGDGRDTIDLFLEFGSGDTLILGTGITRATTVLVRDGLDLLIKPTATDEVRLLGYFANDQWKNDGLGTAAGVMNFDHIEFVDGGSNNLPLYKEKINEAVQEGNACSACDDGLDIFPDTTDNDDNDVVFGWAGDDHLNGGAGDDQLMGDTGDDTLNPGSGKNWLSGGAGADTYQLDANSGNTTIENFDLTTSGTGVPHNRIELLDTVDDEDVRMVREGDDLIIKITGNSNTSVARVLSFFEASGFAELDIIFDSTGAIWNGNCVDFTEAQHCIKNRVLTDAIADDDAPLFADDVLIGYHENNTINGGLGNDRITSYNGNDTLDGGIGNDVLDSGSGSADVLYGDDGNDRLNGGWGGNTLHGGNGDDTLIAIGPYGSSVLEGGPGNDVYQLNDDAWVSIQTVGGTGEDTIQFVGALRASKLWMQEQGDSLVIHVLGSQQEFVVQDWAVTDSQLQHIQAGSCSINRSALQNLVIATGGVEPTQNQNNILAQHWSCP